MRRSNGTLRENRLLSTFGRVRPTRATVRYRNSVGWERLDRYTERESDGNAREVIGAVATYLIPFQLSDFESACPNDCAAREVNLRCELVCLLL